MSMSVATLTQTLPGKGQSSLHVTRCTVEVVPVANLAPPPTGTWQVGWVDPDGTWWIGRGVAAVFSASETRADERVEALDVGCLEHDGAAALDRAKRTLAMLPTAFAAVRAFGALAFDPTRASDPFGAHVPVAHVVVPRWLLRIPAAIAERGGEAETWLLTPLDETATGASDIAQAGDQLAAQAVAKPGVTSPATELDALRHWARNAVTPLPLPVAIVVPDPNAEDDHKQAIQAALNAFSPGGLGKVVLARPAYIETAGHLPPWTLFVKLVNRAPGTSRYCLIGADGATFLGASPERLLALEGDALHVDVLAGTIARAQNAAEDAARVAALRASEKDGREHAFVRDAVLEALAPLTHSLEAAESPIPMVLPTVWHLHTPVRARVRPEVGLADLVRALHPTPAVGGTPRATALETIRRLEPMGRGLYAGPIGWVSAEAAHLAVGIRSAHLRGNRAAAIAGGGIVLGSDPDTEFAETERKLAPMLSALMGEGGL